MIPEIYNNFSFPWEMDFLLSLQNIHNAPLDFIMKAFTFLGNAGIVWIAIALVLTIIPKTRKLGLTMAFAMALTFILGNLVLKPLIARGRPCWINDTVEMLIKKPTDYSFPSGHTMNGITASLCIFFYHHKAGIGAIVVACIIAFSRMYLFVHWPTDILCGALVGAVDAVISFFVVKKIYEAVEKAIAKKKERA